MKQKQIKEKYDLTADVYDNRYKDIQFEKFKLLLQDITLSGTILDHGCGTGLLKEFLNAYTQFEFNNSNGPNRTSSIRVFGIDISFEMLKKAKERGELVVQGDLEHLPFKDKVFDNVLSFTALQNVKHPELALDELKRITNKQLVLSYLDKFDFSKQIERKFNIQEIRQAGEDIGFIATNLKL